ncbi:MAG: solute carrier family 12 sodium/potassium/chloride transporter 2 [Lysobacterales bacterium]|jgi:solute carrier family 12 sodium/potassium/chloride transporter 2
MRKFSTFEGVFTPCLLSILGVIMYLRLGWVVGNVGLAGTVLIIILSNVITLVTTLSMSSVVSNIRIGAGGAYSIISKSLGIEAGGAIGIPLYISQAISTAFYIAGFAECWKFIFPTHDPLFVALIVWFCLSVIAYLSAKLAFRIQYIIIVAIVLSIVAIFIGNADYPKIPVNPMAGFTGASFWESFAIFFPAVTGILAGASMSGELNDPRVSISKGTLSAIGVSFVVYLVLAYWFATHVSSDELINNTNVAVSMGRWSWVVVLGILGATVSSALSMMIGAPRVLLALSKHGVFPLASSFKQVNSKGEPTTAVLFTTLISLVTVMLGSLDQIAILLTMIFMITYGMINLTVFIEQTMGIISFRPTFRVSRLVPFLGALGCIAVMFILDPKFSLVALCLIVLTYWVLIKKKETVYSPDIRSGMLIYLAERFAKAAGRLPYYPKIWKPNLLVPVRDTAGFKTVLGMVGDIVKPTGRVTVFSLIDNDRPISEEREMLSEIAEPLREDNIFIDTTVMCTDNFLKGSLGVMQVISGMFFPPNILFCLVDEDVRNDEATQRLSDQASKDGMGVVLFHPDKRVGLSQRQVINLWIRRQSPNIDLSVLMTLQLQRNWRGRVCLVQVVYDDEEKKEAEVYLNRMKELMRMTLDVDISVVVGSFEQALKDAPTADINIFGMQTTQDISVVRKISNSCNTSVLFLRDSKHESAMA